LKVYEKYKIRFSKMIEIRDGSLLQDP
jgi:diadenosine tetraphosphatase ApaH/serine/threonine PP2A family protein phosphatase